MSWLEILAYVPWVLVLSLPLAVRKRERIVRFPARPAGATPLVSIIVPARDEAHVIGACVTTLLATEYPAREVIVVDDQSGDGTGDIARVLAEHSDGALRVIAGQPLPHGWLGKSWACWQGFKEAHGDLLLFTDADTRHDASVLVRAVNAMQHENADIVTLVPRYQAVSFWGVAVLPQLWLGSMLRRRGLQLLGRGPLSANGQFLLIRRDAYERTRGHEGVRRVIVEDAAMAERVAASGGRTLIAYAESELEARPTSTVRGMANEWTRRLGGTRPFTGFRARAALVLLALTGVVLWLVPPLTLLSSLLGPTDPAVLQWSAIVTAVSLAFWIAVHIKLRMPAGPAIVYPFGAIAVAWVLMRLAFRWKRLAWKGRVSAD